VCVCVCVCVCLWVGCVLPGWPPNWGNSTITL